MQVEGRCWALHQIPIGRPRREIVVSKGRWEIPGTKTTGRVAVPVACCRVAQSYIRTGQDRLNGGPDNLRQGGGDRRDRQRVAHPRPPFRCLRYSSRLIAGDLTGAFLVGVDATVARISTRPMVT